MPDTTPLALLTEAARSSGNAGRLAAVLFAAGDLEQARAAAKGRGWAHRDVTAAILLHRHGTDADMERAVRACTDPDLLHAALTAGRPRRRLVRAAAGRPLHADSVDILRRHATPDVTAALYRNPTVPAAARTEVGVDLVAALTDGWDRQHPDTYARDDDGDLDPAQALAATLAADWPLRHHLAATNPAGAATVRHILTVDALLAAPSRWVADAHADDLLADLKAAIGRHVDQLVSPNPVTHPGGRFAALLAVADRHHPGIRHDAEQLVLAAAADERLRDYQRERVAALAWPDIRDLLAVTGRIDWVLSTGAHYQAHIAACLDHDLDATLAWFDQADDARGHTRLVEALASQDRDDVIARHLADRGHDESLRAALAASKHPAARAATRLFTGPGQLRLADRTGRWEGDVLGLAAVVDQIATPADLGAWLAALSATDTLAHAQAVVAAVTPSPRR